MDNKNDRTDAEEAIAHKTEGMMDQMKGKAKQVAGDLTDDRSLHASGTKDKVKGKLHEAYGDLKEKESRLKSDLDDVNRK